MDKKTLLLSEEQIDEAAELLLQNEIVAFPTETVYGLGGVISSDRALQKIFQAKGRPQDNPLIIHVDSLQCVEKITRDIPSSFYALADVFWPGPLTMILPKDPSVSSIVAAGLPTIGVRMPNHPIARALIRKVQQPIAAPSANLSGKPSATSYQHVWEDFQGKIAAVIAGDCSLYGIESTVIRFAEDRIEILRPGTITQEQLQAQIQEEVVFFRAHNSLEPPPSPGMKYRHYAPNASIFLYEQEEALWLHIAKDPKKKRMVLSSHPLKHPFFYTLSSRTLYKYLRLSDERQCEEILVLCTQEILSDVALMNRLYKAAGYTT